MRIRALEQLTALTLHWIFGRNNTGMWSLVSRRIGPFIAANRAYSSISAFLPRQNQQSFSSSNSIRTFSFQADDNSRKITFITDIEGDRDYLTRYVKQSKVLCFRPCDPRLETNFFPYQHCIDFQRPFRDCLVFGGDIWDQGGSDLYVIRQLLDLKERYPEHVHIVLGNRDINKMRLLQELHLDEQGLLPESYGVYWLKGRKITGDPDERQLLTQSPSERLKWILGNTMGSPRAFDYRKWELEQEELLLRGLEGQSTENFTSTVTDEDVVISYQRSTHPEGEMGRYLSNSNLAFQLGEILFVHGALPLTSEILADVSHREVSTDGFWDDLTFAMPWLPQNTKASDIRVSSIKDWIRLLNNFAEERVASWKEEALKGVPRVQFWSEGDWGYDLIDPKSNFSQLMQYGMGSIPPQGRRNPTIVYNRWCTNGMPRSFFPNSDEPKHAVFVGLVRDFFRRSELAIICTGHQPQGDMPNPIAVPLYDCNRTAWILSCDTSYSGDVNFVNQHSESIKRKGLGRQGSKSGRGLVAVSEVLITQCTTSGKVLDVHWHGILSDGSSYKSSSLDFALHKQDKTQSGILVGCLAPISFGSSLENSAIDGPWWTRAVLIEDEEKTLQKYVLVHGEGFHSYNCIIESKSILRD
ncbi:hypothetical protein FisN_20Lh058 [Fistulifera solaris]|uniref:Calcineurin-like phosphoesterase domain-containing protein n=1 Tax=Fistulifera solaris TaxID=1519565 RepID=A0A1Z5JD00_FISSO|nr:hypothetical protein FisN_20Lh058 [Fistulifera solaris]|eukprot:GAX11883.1 hypothetical protein FisN_20Lh058 [Fistulifera solaris]